MNFIIICTLIGVAAGACGGLFGIGGGIVIVPALVLSLGFSQQKAQGTSLAALLAPIGITAVLNYYRANQVDFKGALFVALGFLAGGYGGSVLAIQLSQEAARKSFAVFLLIVAVYTFFRK